MNRDQIVALLAVLDGGGLIRPASDPAGKQAQITAWAMGLEGVNAQDAHTAVGNLLRSATRSAHYQVWPGDVHAEVKRIRNERLREHGDPLPDVDPDNPELYNARRRQMLAAIGDGAPIPKLIESR